MVSAHGIGDETDIERAVPELCADVVREVQRAVQIEVHVVSGCVLHEILRELEAGELAGDGDVGDDVEAADAPNGRDRRPGARELRRQR